MYEQVNVQGVGCMCVSVMVFSIGVRKTVYLFMSNMVCKYIWERRSQSAAGNMLLVCFEPESVPVWVKYCIYMFVGESTIKVTMFIEYLFIHVQVCE